MTSNPKIEQLELLLDDERKKLLEQNKKRLFEAAEKNDLALIKRIVEREKSVPLKSTDKNLQTVVHIAAKKGHLDVVKYAAEMAPTILYYRDRHGDTLLHLPEEKTVLDVVEYLEGKFNNDIPEWERDDFVSVGIHAAARFGHWQVLKHFIENKNGDANAPNDRHQPPIFTAVQYGKNDILKYLVEERKANLTALDDNNDNVLYVAVSADDLPTMKYVLDEKKADLDVNWQNNFRNTLVHRAAILDRLNIIKYLVEEKHADVNARGFENRTALDLASTRNFYNVCVYLVEEAGADTQARDQFGYFPHQKAYDKNVVDFMKNVSLPKNITAEKNQSFSYTFPRNRRDTYFQLVRLPLADTVTATASGNSLSADGKTSSVFDFYASKLPNFLLIAQYILRDVPGRRFLADVTNLHNRMDPMAVHAVDNLPNFFDE